MILFGAEKIEYLTKLSFYILLKQSKTEGRKKFRPYQRQIYRHLVG